MEYNIGDVVRTKKQHPCGSKLWELTRVGVDFKLKCLGCGHVVTLERQKALKAITKKIEKEDRLLNSRSSSKQSHCTRWVSGKAPSRPIRNALRLAKEVPPQ